MKRMITILLALTLISSLVGCSEAAPKKTEPTTVPTTVATEPPTEPTVPETIPEIAYIQEPMVAVSVPVITEYTQQEETTLFTYSYQYMSLIQPDSFVAEKIVLDFQTRQDIFRADATGYSEQAKAAYTGAEGWTPYLMQALYSPMRVDQNVLSLYGSHVRWTGGFHPEHHCICANYSMITGDVLTLGSILAHEDQIPALGDLVIEAINAVKDEKAIMDGFEVTIRNRLETNVNFDEDWYFSNEGLCFCFSPYEIAPYSSGTIVVTIPYEKLTGVMDDSFFPAERSTVYGEVTASRFQDADQSTLTQIAEVILDREGEMLFLYTDKKVDQVTLELGQWDQDGVVFTPTCAVFATQALTPGDAIMVQTQIPDVMPTLRLSYVSGDETITRYISQSGEDGSILLLEE